MRLRRTLLRSGSPRGSSRSLSSPTASSTSSALARRTGMRARAALTLRSGRACTLPTTRRCTCYLPFDSLCCAPLFHNELTSPLPPHWRSAIAFANNNAQVNAGTTAQLCAIFAKSSGNWRNVIRKAFVPEVLVGDSSNAVRKAALEKARLDHIKAAIPGVSASSVVKFSLLDRTRTWPPGRVCAWIYVLTAPVGILHMQRGRASCRSPLRSRACSRPSASRRTAGLLLPALRSSLTSAMTARRSAPNGTSRARAANALRHGLFGGLPVQAYSYHTRPYAYVAGYQSGVNRSPFYLSMQAYTQLASRIISSGVSDSLVFFISPSDHDSHLFAYTAIAQAPSSTRRRQHPSRAGCEAGGHPGRRACTQPPWPSTNLRTARSASRGSS